jgi:hypothetical protein
MREDPKNRFPGGDATRSCGWTVRWQMREERTIYFRFDVRIQKSMMLHFVVPATPQPVEIGVSSKHPLAQMSEHGSYMYRCVGEEVADGVFTSGKYDTMPVSTTPLPPLPVEMLLLCPLEEP